MTRKPTKTAAQPKNSVKEKVKAAPPVLSATTKSATILALLQSGRGASIAEIATATGWQHHSVRGFLSGTVKKKLGHALANEVSAGTRRYRIAG